MDGVAKHATSPVVLLRVLTTTMHSCAILQCSHSAVADDDVLHGADRVHVEPGSRQPRGGRAVGGHRRHQRHPQLAQHPEQRCATCLFSWLRSRRPCVGRRVDAARTERTAHICVFPSLLNCAVLGHQGVGAQLDKLGASAVILHRVHAQVAPVASGPAQS